MNSHPRLRPTTEADESFLLAAFASGRPELLGLPSELLQLQLTAQRRQYANDYPAVSEQIVVCGSEPVGRCVVSRGATEYRLLDICVVDEYRRRGIGGALVSSLVAEAAAASLPTRLSVWQGNPDAFRLYCRLGFEPCGERSGYVAMQATPARVPVNPAVVL